MRITVEELLRHSYVLSNDARRLKVFYREFERHGLLVHPIPFEGRQVRRDSSEYAVNRHYMAAHFSHMQICELADRQGWPYVCVFEDDAYPCRNIIQELQSYLNRIPDDALICRLGYVPYDGRLSGSGWTAMSDPALSGIYTGGSHAYIIFNDFFQENRRMIRKFIADMAPYIEKRALHNPKFLSLDELTTVWCYEWLMAPAVYRSPFQSRIYSVGLSDNLFAQYSFISWNMRTLRRFRVGLRCELVRKLRSIGEVLKNIFSNARIARQR